MATHHPPWDDPRIPHRTSADGRRRAPGRRSPRLSGYDYATPGAYFVTLCLHDRAHLFGFVRGSKVIRSDAGEMAAIAWGELPIRAPDVEIDEYIVMPDHLHGILVIPGYDSEPPRPTVSGIVGGFKSLTTCRYIAGVREHGWPRFLDRLWQRGFHEHVIRNDLSLNQIREYVRSNPLRWTGRVGR